MFLKIIPIFSQYIFGLFLEAAAHDCCFRLYETAEVIGPALGLYAVVVARL